MLGRFKRHKKQECLYVWETPYAALWGLDKESVIQCRRFTQEYPAAYPETIRPMTDDEMRHHAD